MILIVKIKRYRVCTNITLWVDHGYVNKNRHFLYLAERNRILRLCNAYLKIKKEYILFCRTNKNPTG